MHPTLARKIVKQNLATLATAGKQHSESVCIEHMVEHIETRAELNGLIARLRAEARVKLGDGIH